jgi:uncharacterized membrane protein SpoIIM required for sporulation
MRQEEFEQQYRPLWQQFAVTLDRYQKKTERKLLSKQAIQQLPVQYRYLCHALAIAKQRQYSPLLIEHLDHLVLRGYQALYSRTSKLWLTVVQFIAHGFPLAIQKQKKLFWLTSLLFYGPAIVMFLLTLISPELIYSLLPSDQVSMFEQMYDPEARVLGRGRESDTDFMMFGRYIQNNIGIGFRTFASGIAGTLGTLFFLVLNGLFFGTVAAHIVNIQYHSTFFPFVIGHGSFELTAIVICGMAGIKLGWSLIAPGNLTRFDSLKLATREAILLVYGATLFLLIAAFIEAFWSSSTLLTNTTKYAVGATLWLLVYGYLLWPRKEAIQ